jgi:hypothetical protein
MAKKQSFKEPDPFALDADSEEFFAVGDRPTPVLEKIELEIEEDAEDVRRSSPEVVMRRRRFRKVVTRVVCGVSLVAIAGLGKSALSPANAHAAHPVAVAQAQQPVRVLEAPAQEAAATEKKPEEVAKTDEPSAPTSVATTTAATDPAPAATEPAPAPTEAPPKKIARAKRDDDFGDLDVKIDVPKIDTSMTF